MKRPVQASLLALCLCSATAVLAGCEEGPAPPSPNNPPKPKMSLDAPSIKVVSLVMASPA